MRINTERLRDQAHEMLRIIEELVAEFDAEEKRAWEAERVSIPCPASVTLGRDCLQYVWETEDPPVWNGERWLTTFPEIDAHFNG